MKETFSYWKNLYDSDKLEEFNFNRRGLLWLKIKSIKRKSLIREFINDEKIILHSNKLEDQFVEIFNSLKTDLIKSHSKINVFINRKSAEQIATLDDKNILSGLNKLESYKWGGDHKNSLDKFLVSRFVKTYQSYDHLSSKFETEIAREVKNYIHCSWYNHWSNILIENIFKQHKIVLPTVGQIKKIDFFINEIPFDLKVTHLPKNLIEKRRKAAGLKPELTELKAKARKAKIQFNKDDTENNIYREIVEEMKKRDDEFCREALQNIKDVRLEILNQVIQNPRELIQNLYEQQGELRFDASNRLFLILVDTEDFDNSWKLKRNLDLLTPNIKKYLDDFAEKKIEELKVTFNYKGKDQTFTALSDAIFILK